MAHYAKVENGIVTQVIVADSVVWCEETLGGEWIQTSYNTFWRSFIATARFHYIKTMQVLDIHLTVLDLLRLSLSLLGRLINKVIYGKPQPQDPKMEELYMGRTNIILG
jgi:hypothetical protein